MKKKLELNKLQVSSFVTALSKNNEQSIKGGTLSPIQSAVALGFGMVLGAIVSMLPLAVVKLNENKVEKEQNESNDKESKK